MFLVIGSTDQLFQHNYVECTLAFDENLPKCPIHFYLNENSVSDICNIINPIYESLYSMLFYQLACKSLKKL